MNLLEKFFSDPELDPEEGGPEDRQRRRTLAHARQQHLVGMGRMKTPTGGQIARAHVREVAARKRKHNSRYRRNWLRNQQAIAVLRGQFWVMDHPDRVTPELRANTKARLEAAYGDLQAAREHYNRTVLGKS